MNPRIQKELDELYERLKQNPTEESLQAEFLHLDYLNCFEGLTPEDRNDIFKAYSAVNYLINRICEAQRNSRPANEPNLQDTAENTTQTQALSQPETREYGLIVVQQSPQEKTPREIFERLMREDSVRVKAAIGNGATLNQILAPNTPSAQAAALNGRIDPSEEFPSLYAEYLEIKLEFKETELEILRVEKTEQAQNNEEILSKWVKTAGGYKTMIDEQNEALYELRGTEYELNRKLEVSKQKVKQLIEENVQLERLHRSSTLDADDANANYVQILEVLESTRSESEAKIDQLKSGLKHAERQIKELKKTVETLEKQRSDLSMANDKLNIQNEELEAAQKNAEEVIQGMMATEEELKREAQEAQDKIQGLETDARNLNASLRYLQADRNQLYEEFVTTRTERLEFRSQNADLSRELKTAEDTIDSLKQDVEVAEKQCLDAQKECEELNASNEELQLTLTELEEDLGMAEYRIECMKEEIEIEKEKYQKACSEKDELEATLRNVSISQEISEENYNKAQIEMEKLKTQKYWDDDYIEHLKQDLSEIEKHEKELLEGKEVMESSIEELKRNQEALELAQTEAQSQIENLTSKLELADERILFMVDKLRTENSIYKQACIEITELKTSNEKLKELLEVNGTEMKQLQSDFGHTRVALRSTQSRCESDIQKLTMKLRNAEKVAEDMKKQVDAEVMEKQKLKEKLQESELVARDQKAEFCNTVAGFQGEMDNFMKQQTFETKKMEKTEAELETARFIIDKMSVDLKKLQTDKKESDKRWEKAHQKLLDELKNRNLRIAKVCHEAIQYHTKMNSVKEEFKKSEEIAKEEMKKMMKKYKKQGELLAKLQREKEEKKMERMELENEGYDLYES